MANKPKVRIVDTLMYRQFEGCISIYRELAHQYSGLLALVGGDHESPLGRAVWRTFENYTTALSQCHGDDYGWLGWYIYDNDCGLRKKIIFVAGVPHEICNMEDLVEVIMKQLVHDTKRNAAQKLKDKPIR